MSLKTKLTFGLAFLFLIIFALAIYGSFQIQRLSKDAKAIIKDNYDSLVYCKGMLLALDDMKTAVTNQVVGSRGKQMSQSDGQLFAVGKATFESNLAKERNNITEIHEGDYVKELSVAYDLFLSLCAQMGQASGSSVSSFSDVVNAYTSARLAISRIDDVNMEAVQRKSDSAAFDANRMIASIGVAGAICIILGFFYFWYFPFFVSNSLSYLAQKMKDLLKSAGVELDTQSKDETFVLLQSINLLENKVAKNVGRAKKRLG
jgi:two-component system, NtrC family, sensor histidine kinase KinB